MNQDLVKYSLKNLWQRKMRSFLTVLSILIGVMAIFAIVSFGLGIRNYMDVLAKEAGSDKLFIQSKGVGAPGTDGNFYISEDDIDYVRKIKGVSEITGFYMKPGEVKFRDQTKYYFLLGMDPEKQDFIDETFTVKVEEGRSLKKGEIGKIVLGYNYHIPDKIFEKPVKVGDKVELNGEKVEVIGFYGEVGNPSDDGNIYASHKQLELMYDDIAGQYGYVIIRSEKGVDPEELADKIEEKLRKYKGQDEGKEDFFVQTFADVLQTFGMIINILNGILVLIALVSMVVASVNIMNTMYTAVLERTKEIGIMKAIGAQTKDIMFIFIFESGVLGLIGGIIGIFLGYVVASIGGWFAAESGFSILQPIFPMSLILGCLLFSFLVGAFSGILPARQASRQNPVVALKSDE